MLMKSFLRPLAAVMLLAVASMANVSAAGFPTEAQVIKDLKAKYPDRAWDVIKFKPKREWVLDYEKVARTLPPDTAKHMMVWTEKKKADGSWMSYEGFAIYRRDVAGPGPWIFNRCFIMGGNLKGKKEISREDLTKQLMEAIQASAGSREAMLWWGSPESLYHVYWTKRLRRDNMQASLHGGNVF